MKLKEKIPVYRLGSLVTIIDDLESRFVSDTTTDAGLDDTMKRYQGSKVQITNIRGVHYTVNIDGSQWSWSYNMFKESYEDMNETPTFEVGTYLYHQSYVPGFSNVILLQITDITEREVKCKFIYETDKEAKKHLLEKGNIFAYSNSKVYNDDKEVRYIDTQYYVSRSLFIPSNEELYKTWGVTNKTEENSQPLKEGMLVIPNIFEKSKYPVNRLRIEDPTSKRRFLSVRSGYYFEIRKDLIVGFNGTKLYSLRNQTIVSRYSLKDKDYKEILVNWGKVRVKSYETSSELFAHKTRKKAMFEASDSKDKSTYKISNVIFNFEKEGKYYHVLEINDGTLNLKFSIDDLDIILPNCDNYNPPKDRNKLMGDQCKIVNDKLLPLRRGSVVKITKIFNRHTPVSTKSPYDKNSIAVVIDSNHKQFECKLKQLKKV